MKKIIIKIINFDQNDSCSYGNFILKSLEKYYEVEFSENPEYLFFNESAHEHLKYNCVKIFYTGENIHPNFNFCDYAIGFDYLDFRDRYFRLPVYKLATFYQKTELDMLPEYDLNKKYPFTENDLKNKTGFCSFVYSNYLAENERKTIFEKLSKYKKVNSGGAYLNNLGHRINNKLEFELKHKFSIAFENSSNPGYTTEKIVTSLIARTIPIYWGNPEIEKEFNGDRFINCHKYENFDQVVQKVIQIDNDDQLYLKMINSPIFVNNYVNEMVVNFELFLRQIIDQPIKNAKRIKINPIREKDLIRNEMWAYEKIRKNNWVTKILSKIYRPFKKIEVLEKAKQNYFKFIRK